MKQNYSTLKTKIQHTRKSLYSHLSNATLQKPEWLNLGAQFSLKPIENLPKQPIAVNAIVICTNALPTACPTLPPVHARIGVSTNNGTTIRSCNKSVPNDERPYCVFI